MSLFIVGSCSKITRNIVLQLAKNNQYNQITVGDVLPHYDLHQRYYQLRRDLSDAKLKTQVGIEKLIQPSELYKSINKADDVLFVTHDYYSHVPSKTKFMKLVAQYAKNKSHAFFATPVQYDHYGFTNPQENYIKTQNQVRSIFPNATIIRSDIQDKTQLFSYYNSGKNILEQQLLRFALNKGFAPRVVNSGKYAQIVAQMMKSRAQGKLLCIRGQKQVRIDEVVDNKQLDSIDYGHAKQNIRNILSKYNGVIGQGLQLVQAV